MAMGLPTVAFNTPVQREYLGELGVYAPAGDVDRFGDAIAGLLANPQRRAELSTALRQRAIERYSCEHSGRTIVSVYDQLCSGEGN
jgi:glycosyltransferase involved in cell wall biosynthesis